MSNSVYVLKSPIKGVSNGINNLLCSKLLNNSSTVLLYQFEFDFRLRYLMARHAPIHLSFYAVHVITIPVRTSYLQRSHETVKCATHWMTHTCCMELDESNLLEYEYSRSLSKFI